jgi:hypothetical protein
VCIGTAVEWYDYSFTLLQYISESNYSLSLRLFSVCSDIVCRDYPISNDKIGAARAMAVISCISIALNCAASILVAAEKWSDWATIASIVSRWASALFVCITLGIVAGWQVDTKVTIVEPVEGIVSIINDSYHATAGFGLFSTSAVLLILCARSRFDSPSPTSQVDNPLAIQSRQ